MILTLQSIGTRWSHALKKGRLLEAKEVKREWIQEEWTQLCFPIIDWHHVFLQILQSFTGTRIEIPNAIRIKTPNTIQTWPSSLNAAKKVYETFRRKVVWPQDFFPHMKCCIHKCSPFNLKSFIYPNRNLLNFFFLYSKN